MRRMIMRSAAVRLLRRREGGYTLEKRLKALFDFQAFEQNRELQDVIDSVHARYAVRRELDMDEADMVNAAGDPHIFQKKKENGEENI